MESKRTSVLASPHSRLQFESVAGADHRDDFRKDVLLGLSSQRKRLPSIYFYDEQGSKLFESITALPEYYLTRAEQAVLESSSDSIIQEVGAPLELVEFGSGSSRKSRLLIEAALRVQPELTYIPIDISERFLRSSAEALVADYPALTVCAVAAEYEDGLDALQEAGLPRLFMFMGSSIGNMDSGSAVSFLRRIRSACRPQDRILLGADLVKDLTIIQGAYNDLKGVTEAFNKNLLARINRELGGDLNLDAFRHDAPFLPEKSYVEMRLVSMRDQTVTIRDLARSFEFAEGETLVTEHSHKYTPDSVRELAAQADLLVERFWFDEPAWFTVALLSPRQP